MMRMCDKCGCYMKPHLEYSFYGAYFYYTCQCCGATTARESYTNTSSDKCVRGHVDFIKPEIKMIRRRRRTNDSST